MWFQIICPTFLSDSWIAVKLLMSTASTARSTPPRTAEPSPESHAREVRRLASLLDTSQALTGTLDLSSPDAAGRTIVLTVLSVAPSIVGLPLPAEGVLTFLVGLNPQLQP